jgi:hypothetical protein
MEPERDSSLVEILDRLLNKGAVLNADLIITVAGIPLIGLNLRAALASMETMLEYGVMEDWDRNSREQYARQEIKLKLAPGEEILFKAFGYLWQDEGVISHWVPGIWNITSQRIFLWLRSPGKILFEAPLENLQVTRLQALTVEKWALELNFFEGSAQVCSPECLDFIYSLLIFTFFFYHLILSPCDSRTFLTCTLLATWPRMQYQAFVDTTLCQATHGT